MKLQPSNVAFRNIPTSTCHFTEHFKGFNTVGAVTRIFGAKTTEVLAKLTVKFTNSALYMRVDDDGHLIVNPEYFRIADSTELYLDVIHELVHVKQVMEGKTSNKTLNYVDRPLEIEAYSIAVNEARNLELREDQILEYLSCELVSGHELRKLSETLKLDAAAIDKLTTAD